MRPKPFLKNNIALALMICCVSLTLMAWDFKDQSFHFIGGQQNLDTVPKNKNARERKVRDLDEVLNELERSKLEVETSLKNVDFEKINKEIKESLKNIDAEKIRMDVEKAMKEIDFEKINKEIKESLKNIDAEKIRMDVEKAMKEIDFEKINKEIEASMAKVDWKKMEKELEELRKMDFSKLEADMKKVEEEMKNIRPKLEKELEEIKKMDFSKLEADMKKLEIEMKELGPKLEKDLAKAKIEIDKAKEDIKEYKSFVDGLDKDGLINKKQDYTIEHTDGELIINGKKQPTEVYNKYRKFLEKHKKFSLKKTPDDFNIDMD